MRRGFLFERLWTPIIGFMAFLFVGWFFIAEFEGLAKFASFLVDSIAAFPNSIKTVIDYYAHISARQLASSLIVGAIVGAISTTVFYLSIADVVKVPAPSIKAVLIGVTGGVIALFLSVSLFYALIIIALVSFVAEYILQPDARQAFSGTTLHRLQDPDALRLIGRGIFFGGVSGAIGSQILTYITRHCTYAPDVEAAHYQAGLIITAISAFLILIPVWTYSLRKRKSSNQSTSGYFRGWILPFAFLAPTVISLIVFLYYPGVQVATLSLIAQRFRQERFVCLGNYSDLLTDKIYQNSLLTTLSLTVGIVIFSMAVGLAIATLVSQKVRGAGIYRTFLIWPYALSPVVTGVIFLAVFREGRSGLINYGLLETFNITPRWFTNPSLAPWVIIFASVWNALGFNILFYIAGLQNIPKDLLEAAEIDGANRFQRFLRITFPLLSPFTFFLLVTNVTYSFYGIYGAIDALTQGGPPLGVGGQDGGATNVLIYKLYQDAFAPGAQVGGAAAQAVILFLLVAGITVIQFRYLEARVTYAD
jgi:sn-glycerol 3-phosphate transport system permease protein